MKLILPRVKHLGSHICMKLFWMVNEFLWCLNGFLLAQLLGCTEIFDVAKRVIITAQQQVGSFDRGAELGGIGNGAGGAQLDRQREEGLVN